MDAGECPPARGFLVTWRPDPAEGHHPSLEGWDQKQMLLPSILMLSLRWHLSLPSSMSQPSSQPRARLGQTPAFVPKRCPGIYVLALLGMKAG